MPTLVRLLTALALIAGTVLAAMAALVAFVEPVPVPVTIAVPVPLPGEPAAAGRSADAAPTAGTSP